ncbi:MAG: glycosyltransferase family 2 protein [Candidatus Paceibacterota bacterium]
MTKNHEISVVIPCLNEEKGIGFCLEEAMGVIRKRNLSAEIVVVDNNSTDKTAEIVSEYQKKFADLVLVNEERPGYGAAYLKGLAVASGKYLIMADGDGTYDFSLITDFVSKLKSGFDLVVGNRFATKDVNLVMPWLHRRIGNPFLSFLVRAFFGAKIKDVHCGMRAITRRALEAVDLNTTGMEFASEMVIKVARRGLKIGEVDISYRKRFGDSKLESFSDGWRHLRFILLYSPLLLFLLPGLIILGLGVIGLVGFYFGSLNLFGMNFYVHPMFVFSVMILLGYQLVAFSAFSKIYAISHLGDHNRLIESLFRKITVERASILGMTFFLLGLLIYLFIFVKWFSSGFGELDEIKNSIVALTLLVVGVQTFFSAFMLSTLGIKSKQ